MDCNIHKQNENFQYGFIRNRKHNEKIPLWDSFQDPPSKRLTGSATNWHKLTFILKLLKLVTYLFVFGIILITALLSKLSYIFMVAQLDGDTHVRICNIFGTLIQFITLITNGLIKDQNTVFIVQPSIEEQMVWIWGIIFSFASPELLTFLRALRISTFKGVKSPTWTEVSLVIAFELLHVVGLAILTFAVLPQFDSCRALMLCNCVCFIPALLKTFIYLRKEIKSILLLGASVVSLIFQATAFVMWPIHSNSICIQIISIPLLFISFRWWENYINSCSNLAHIIKTISRTKSRYQIYLYLSPIKVCVFAWTAFILHGRSITEYFTSFSSIWKPHKLLAKKVYVSNSTQLIIEHVDETESNSFFIQSNSNALTYLILLQIISSYICYIFSKFACKIKIQKFSFSLSLSIVGPISVGLVIAVSELHNWDICIFHNYMPDYLSFKIDYNTLTIWETVVANYLWVWFFWWLSQLYITNHIWYPYNDKNAPTEKLFICPWYCPFLVDQCILMNRRIHVWNDENLASKDIALTSNEIEASLGILDSDKIPQLIVCATMWHETQEEMMEFLKSIIRLDEDQCARRMAKTYINNGKADEEYYEFETNIFFDDAFILDKNLCENEKNPPLNEYAKILITSIEKAVFEVYGVIMKIKPPVKIETPYGGRLVWTLPGRSKMIAHLKNKNKIRHKKRWSQVMYMYYLLGYRIMELNNVTPQRKTIIAENTFLLALDGDIDFQPQAVQLLIDRMKAIDELGAACGRIHPVGRGPMVWYQIFEYAIGHWLQKATEHVIGCVLCSPGCFSLFRGSALMQNSVVKKYTTVSQEPMHYVQYDQGEDRWLCTLILKQGLRVEYSAASDAYTHSPEMFNEFFNQRRRWVPSTIANIFDLLTDANQVIKKNSSISLPYIAYQGMLMVGTILGPGTIFLMLVGALVAVFNINIWTSFLWNFIPIIFFILSCIYFKQKIQLLLAFVISTMYCLVMMAVLIGIIIQIIEDGPLAPASVFFLVVFLQIFIAGVVHPQEISALLCGFIYYITIPSMYMLLMIYSVFNMNDVSWGTREAAAKKEDAKEEDTIDEEKEKEYLPGWVNDPYLVESELGEICLREKRFWKDLIKQYLRPLYHTEETKSKVADSLRELRNMFSFAFIMINSIFVLIVFLLQLKKDYLHIKWPIDPTDYIVFDDINSQIYIYRHYKELDPIGLLFVVFFGLILLIQFFAMFIHRFSTFSQLLATTSIDWFRSSNAITEEEAVQEIRGNAVNIARQLQKPKRFEDVTESLNSPLDEDEEGMVRRQTIFKLHENRNRKQDYSDLPRNFERRFLGEDDIEMKHISISRKSMMLLNETRFVAKRRLTQNPSSKSNFNNEICGTKQGYDNNAYVCLEDSRI